MSKLLSYALSYFLIMNTLFLDVNIAFSGDESCTQEEQFKEYFQWDVNEDDNEESVIYEKEYFRSDDCDGENTLREYTKEEKEYTKVMKPLQIEPRSRVGILIDVPTMSFTRPSGTIEIIEYRINQIKKPQSEANDYALSLESTNDYHNPKLAEDFVVSYQTIKRNDLERQVEQSYQNASRELDRISENMKNASSEIKKNLKHQAKSFNHQAKSLWNDGFMSNLPRLSENTELFTSDNMPGADKLKEILDYKTFAEEKIIGMDRPKDRKELLNYADVNISFADLSYSEGNINTGNTYIEHARYLIDVALDFIPFVSLAKDVVSITTGTNPITGELLSQIDRGIFLGLILVPSLVSAPARQLAKIGRKIDFIRKQGHLLKKGLGFVKGILSEIGERSIGVVDKIFSSARKLGVKTGVGTKIYAKLHKPLQSLPNGLKVKRIREGADSTKIAVIGRKMPGVVDDTAAHLRKSGAKIETFSDDVAWKKFKKRQIEYNRKNGIPDKTYLPHNEVVKTDMYKNNKAWAQKLKDDGYTVIDLGDPLNATYGSSGGVAQSILESELKGEGMSIFYSIEKKILFGE